MIRGLTYKENYISDHQHDWLLNKINNSVWLNDLQRRVQHYGYKYDYKARRITKNAFISELPLWLKKLSEMIYKDGYMPECADQVIINEYVPGQGISYHTDCEPCFKDTIISLSLGSGCLMNFLGKDSSIVMHWLEPKSLLVLSGEARYDWQHAILPRVSDTVDLNEPVWKGTRAGSAAAKIKRTTRISLTFRNVILQ